MSTVLDKAVDRLARSISVYDGDMGASLAGNSANLVLNAIKTHSSPTLTLPDTSVSYQKSTPFPTEFKADINKRKGEVTAYLTVFVDDDGKQIVDPYRDAIERGAFNATVAEHEKRRKRTNEPFLMLYLWQHDRTEPLGGIKSAL